MKTFYWYSAGVVVVFILVLIGTVIYTNTMKPKSAGNNSGLVTMVALAGPMAAIWFIALGWVVTIFWRKFMSHDATLSQSTFYIACALLLIVLKAPFDAYKNFFPKS